MFVHELAGRGNPASIAFCGKEPVTYKELQAKIISYRNFFYQSGIRQSENVGLFSRNSAEYIYSYMAIVSLGAIAVPINFQLTARETAYIVRDAQMKHLVTAVPLALQDELLSIGYSGDLQQLVIADIQNSLACRTPQTAPPLAADFSADAPCVIIYTSGTTGSPKGAVLSHNNLLSNAEAFRQALGIREDDNILCVLPMYHCFAWTCAVLNPLLCGASITILDSFSPKETIAAIQEYQISVIYGVPPIYNFLSRVGEARDLENVRLFVSGGASLPETIARQFFERYGKPIVEGYGLSEASPVVAVNPPEKPKYYSIGKSLPGLIIRIVGPSGETLPPGEVGELTVKGPSVMLEYYNLPLETSLAVKNGVLHTGDLAYQDSEGYLYIVDRLKDMIIANGENIYPREIEEVLYTYPGIVEAAVIGVPDGLRGQAVCAYLVFAEGFSLDKKSLREYLLTRLAAYKIPRDVFAVDALPKSQTGKILKRLITNSQRKPVAGECVG